MFRMIAGMEKLILSDFQDFRKAKIYSYLAAEGVVFTISL